VSQRQQTNPMDQINRELAGIWQRLGLDDDPPWLTPARSNAKHKAATSRAATLPSDSEPVDTADERHSESVRPADWDRQPWGASTDIPNDYHTYQPRRESWLDRAMRTGELPPEETKF